MLFIFALGIIVVLLFGTVVIVGPPYLPTKQKQIKTALDLLQIGPGDTLLELGSGDGRVMLAAARRGANVVGYELNPLLVLISWLWTLPYRKQVTIVWGNYWTRPWPVADAIFTFMLPRQMARLDQKIATWHMRPVRFASFAFFVPGKKPVAQQDGVFLYTYK
ncbi:MAG TPA: hypothetical protein VHT70_00340 [Candidatus Saccharimonadales bacterium]|jgi:hypothetical protein|nr:hypothetical protein [Candidatus Saccharimonadales bacterium]